MNQQAESVETRRARLHGLRASVDALLTQREELERVAASLAGATAALDAQLVSMQRMLDTEQNATEGVRFRPENEIARRSFVAEYAAALTISSRAAEARLNFAEQLAERAATLEALCAGRLSEAHARVIVTETLDLEPEVRARVEASALDAAPGLTPPQLRRHTVRQRERLQADTLDDRHEKAHDRRRVWVENGSDGMAWLTAHLSAVDAALIHDRLTGIARAQKRVDPEDDRTAEQRRADALRDLLIAGVTGDGTGGGIVASVTLTAPAATLAGHSDEPAEVDGVGPVDRATARGLLDTAGSFARAVVDADDGSLLGLETCTYRLTASLRRFLELRDGTCRFPGCTAPVARADADHTIDAQYGGATADDNLAHLCRKHHTLKHATAWTPEHAPDGSGDLLWTSPLGRHYVTRPQRPSRVRARVGAGRHHGAGAGGGGSGGGGSGGDGHGGGPR